MKFLPFLVKSQDLGPRIFPLNQEKSRFCYALPLQPARVPATATHFQPGTPAKLGDFSLFSCSRHLLNPEFSRSGMLFFPRPRAALVGGELLDFSDLREFPCKSRRPPSQTAAPVSLLVNSGMIATPQSLKLPI
ncbi:hypothetical protein SLEP1_g26514 [Rubroshorea leprosula]|uniref:Uncharacterized protein n=1 Tax=Rubroshorea leprosula TaxID=152421 RepID=A0AAV5JY01_9ROSI|nr:hypothetical protein SLEP1_g26514 [Rubroshorea leprosula]